MNIKNLKKGQNLSSIIADLLIKERFQSAIDILEMIINNDSEEELKNYKDSMKRKYLHLGFAYMKLRRAKLAKKYLIQSYTEEKKLESRIYLGDLYCTLYNNYLDGLKSYRQAHKMFLEKKGELVSSEFNSSGYTEKIILNNSLKFSLDAMKKGELFDQHLNIHFLLRDLMMITPKDRNIYKSIGYVLEDFIDDYRDSEEKSEEELSTKEYLKKYRFKNEIEKEVRLLKLSDYMQNENNFVDEYMYKQFFKDFTNYLHYDENYDFHFYLVKRKFQSGLNYLFEKDSPPSLKNIFESIDLINKENQVEVEYFIFNKYGESISVIKLCLMKENPKYFEAYYSDNISLIDNVLKHPDYFSENYAKSKYQRNYSSERAKILVSNYFKYNEIKDLDRWGNFEIKSKRYSTDYDSEEKIIDLFNKDEEIFKLNEIRVGYWTEMYEEPEQEIIDFFIENNEKFSNLKKLFICDVDYEECEVSWIHQMNYSNLWKALPNLEEITIKGSEGLILGDISHKNLKKLQIITGGLPKTVLQDIIDATIPNLEELCLYFGDEYYGCDIKHKEIEELIYILEGQENLKRLSLVNSQIQDFVIEKVLASKLVNKLESLDFSYGTLGNKGAENIIYAIDNLPNLKKLTIIHHFISESYQAILKEKCESLKIDLLLDDYNEEEDSERYVFLSE